MCTGFVFLSVYACSLALCACDLSGGYHWDLRRSLIGLSRTFAYTYMKDSLSLELLNAGYNYTLQKQN